MWESKALSMNQHQSYGGSKTNYNLSTFKALNIWKFLFWPVLLNSDLAIVQATEKTWLEVVLRVFVCVCVCVF